MNGVWEWPQINHNSGTRSRFGVYFVTAPSVAEVAPSQDSHDRMRASHRATRHTHKLGRPHIRALWARCPYRTLSPVWPGPRHSHFTYVWHLHKHDDIYQKSQPNISSIHQIVWLLIRTVLLGRHKSCGKKKRLQTFIANI